METTELSELIAWAGAAILTLVIAYYMVFGKADIQYKYQKVFGLKSTVLSNKSAKIPTKVALYAFGSAAVCFVVAGVLYAQGL